MNGMIGADPDALERLAGDFDRGAGSLESVVLRVRTSVHANPWSGARATRFRNDWDQRHGPQLKRTATTLRTAAKQLRQQAQEQRQASSAGGGSAASSGARAISGTNGFARSLEDGLDRVLTGTEIVGALDSFREMAKGKSSFLGHGLQVIGVAAAFSDLITASARGDRSGALTALADGVFATVSAPVSILYSGLKAEIGFFIPLDLESQDDHLQWMADRGYSPSQIADRYQGVQGFIDLGNDNVERKAPWMNRAAEWATAKPAEWLYNAGIKL